MTWCDITWHDVAYHDMMDDMKFEVKTRLNTNWSSQHCAVCMHASQFDQLIYSYKLRSVVFRACSLLVMFLNFIFLEVWSNLQWSIEDGCKDSEWQGTVWVFMVLGSKSLFQWSQVGRFTIGRWICGQNVQYNTIKNNVAKDTETCNVPQKTCYHIEDRL